MKAGLLVSGKRLHIYLSRGQLYLGNGLEADLEAADGLSVLLVLHLHPGPRALVVHPGLGLAKINNSWAKNSLIFPILYANFPHW